MNAPLPKFCELTVRNGQFIYRSMDDAKAEILADTTVGLAKRFFAVRDDAGENTDARDFFRPRGEKARNFHLVRDAMQGPGSAEYVQHLDGGITGSVSPANHDSFRFQREANNLLQLGVIKATDALSMSDWDSHQALANFFGKVNDVVHAAARKGQARLVLDAAPSIYVFSELLKHVPVLVEEELTQLWARRIFPIRNLNTWMPQWSYKRYGRRGQFPQNVDSEFVPSSIPQQSERIKPVLRSLVYYDNGCFWDMIELERHAEAVANGAANISLDRDRIDTAIRMMLWKENLLTWFGSPEDNILGMFSDQADTQVERIPAAGLFGGGTTEQDRALLTNPAKQIIAKTEQALQPNIMMLSTLTWLYVNDKRYGDLGSDSNQTIAQAALATLEQFGITSFLWVPEVGFRAAERDRLLLHGVPTAEANRLAGGLDQEQTIVCGRRDPKTAEMIVAKERIMYPAQSTIHGRTEVRMLQGSGGMEFYQPAAWNIITNVGPNTLL